MSNLRWKLLSVVAVTLAFAAVGVAAGAIPYGLLTAMPGRLSVLNPFWLISSV